MNQNRARVRLLFGLLGTVPVFLAGWLGWLQVVQGASIKHSVSLQPLPLDARAVERQAERQELLPGARGSICDRRGVPLAMDCPAFDIEAEVTLKLAVQGEAAATREFLGRITEKLAKALALDPDLPDANQFRCAQRDRIGRILAARFRLDELPKQGKVDPRVSLVVKNVNFFLQGRVDSLAVLQALRGAADSFLTLHFAPTHHRVYPFRDYTYGVVGWEGTVPPPRDAADPSRFVRKGLFGLEMFDALNAGSAGERDFLRDSTGNHYWLGAAAAPDAALSLDTTLDIDLQKYAMDALRQAIADVVVNGVPSPPQWGALVLLDIASGDVLAMANWQRGVPEDQPERMMATPYQCRFEPGSIVKPLVFAFALQHGGIDWHDPINCTPNLADHGRMTSGGRVIHDDHACGVLTPHDILVNSSNIGAAEVGQHLSREQWRQYLDFYRFGEPSGLRLPFEVTGTIGRFDTTDKGFRRYTATALSIGYQMNVTVLGMARAYLTMLSGAQRDLRLYRGLRGPDAHVEIAPKPPGARELSPAVVEAVTAAMIDVVGPESEGNRPTGSRLIKQFRDSDHVELHGLVAGKTGTAASNSHDEERGSFVVRNASFVGFAPATAPRYLAVCVLQKDDDARFYGGSYAAPTVVRVLLHALELDQLRRLRQEPPVSGTPGRSGWNGQIPETVK